MVTEPLTDFLKWRKAKDPDTLFVCDRLTEVSAVYEGGVGRSDTHPAFSGICSSEHLVSWNTLDRH